MQQLTGWLKRYTLAGRSYRRGVYHAERYVAAKRAGDPQALQAVADDYWREANALPWSKVIPFDNGVTAGFTRARAAKEGVMQVRLEWKPQDMWVGIFWRRSPGQTDVWICLLPMVPLHLTWGAAVKALEEAERFRL